MLNKKKQRNQLLPYRILSALERGPAAVSDLSASQHRSDTQIRNALRDLQAQGLIHAAGYRRSPRGIPTKLFALGRGSGAEPEKPARLSGAERCKAWRDRGNDQHRARKIKREMAALPYKMTLAGQLLPQHHRPATDVAAPRKPQENSAEAGKLQHSGPAGGSLTGDTWA